MQGTGRGGWSSETGEWGLALALWALALGAGGIRAAALRAVDGAPEPTHRSLGRTGEGQGGQTPPSPLVLRSLAAQSQ